MLFLKICDLTGISFKNCKIDESKSLRPGDKVTHSIFGDGVVVSVNKDLATIAFSYKVGIKTIAANHKYLTKKN